MIDLQSGRLAAAWLPSDLSLGAKPVVEEGNGALWFVASAGNTSMLVHTGPHGGLAGLKRLPLPADVANDWTALWIDEARGRVIVGNDSGQFLGFALASGHRLWALSSPYSAPYDGAGAGRIYDPRTGELWIVNQDLGAGQTTVTMADVQDGRKRRMQLGGSGVQPEGLFQVPN